MIVTQALLLAVSATLPPQTPASGEVGKFRWPPVATGVLRYEGKLAKYRVLPKDVAKAERAARKSGGLHPAKRSLRQSISIGVTIDLDVQESAVVGAYQTSLIKQSLHMDVPKAKRPRAPKKGVKPRDASSGAGLLPLGSRERALVWGVPPKKAKKLKVARGRIERKFTQTFPRAGKKGAQPKDLRQEVGSHLLPVRWDRPLPSWLGTLVSVAELGGVAVVEGKQVIREGTEQHPWGFDRIRVESKFTKASTAGFTMSYKLSVEENRAAASSGGATGASAVRTYEVVGIAAYSFREQAWTSIEEAIRARPKALTEDLLRRLSDEVFEGSIKIHLVRGAKKKARRGR